MPNLVYALPIATETPPKELVFEKLPDNFFDVEAFEKEIEDMKANEPKTLHDALTRDYDTRHGLNPRLFKANAPSIHRGILRAPVFGKELPHEFAFLRGDSSENGMGLSWETSGWHPRPNPDLAMWNATGVDPKLTNTLQPPSEPDITMDDLEPSPCVLDWDKEIAAADLKKFRSAFPGTNFQSTVDFLTVTDEEIASRTEPLFPDAESWASIPSGTDDDSDSDDSSSDSGYSRVSTRCPRVIAPLPGRSRSSTPSFRALSEASILSPSTVSNPPRVAPPVPSASPVYSASSPLLSTGSDDSEYVETPVKKVNKRKATAPATRKPKKTVKVTKPPPKKAAVLLQDPNLSDAPQAASSTLDAGASPSQVQPEESSSATPASATAAPTAGPSNSTTVSPRVGPGGQLQYPCPFQGCPQVCGSAGDLSRHVLSRAHTAPSFKCLSCNYSFTRPDALKRHHKKRPQCRQNHFSSGQNDDED